MDSSVTARLASYQRLEHNDVGIYVNPDCPDWFVPTSMADGVLRLLSNDGLADEAARGEGDIGRSGYALERFIARLVRGNSTPYGGRSAHLKLKGLRECWFHVTNRCNLSCGHCMFSSGPARQQQLAPELLRESVSEARKLGCEVFYFTGGEPLIYPELLPVCREILSDANTHVVILTNGIAVETLGDELVTLDRERVAFQVSLDGGEKNNDAIRGAGTFGRIQAGVRFLLANQFNVSLAMSVSRTNFDDMQAMVHTAASWGVGNVHYVWFFRKGKGDDAEFVPASDIGRLLVRAYDEAKEAGVLIDNVEILKSQVFSLPGTRFDLSNAAWESLAVGPDGQIYPSAALIGEAGMAAGQIADGIENVWGSSPVLRAVREASIANDSTYGQNPLRFLVGGGDIDHSFTTQGRLTGGDPYVELYNHVALELIAEEACRYRDEDRLALRSRMGERLHECGEGMGPVAFTHSNCVLSLPGKDGHTLVKNFYSTAAEEPKEEIYNPVSYGESDIGHVPEASRVRSYGCGSPVLDGDVQVGETLVDLGSGTGVECFIAAKKVGPTGRVIGIDMAETMLAVAEKSKAQVVENLGYDNVSFLKAFFEETPVASGSVDAVISNCVINLSPDKRRTFSEIFRMLKPGGRAVVSDICYEDDIPLEIKYNQKLRGECIGGAFKQDELFGLLVDIGFEGARVVKRFPYRNVAKYTFYSITYSVRKPVRAKRERVLYRGPFAAVITDDGQYLARGVTTEAALPEGFGLDDSVFRLDKRGQVTNVEQAMTCGCLAAPPAAIETKHIAGCMVCGAELAYRQANSRLRCCYCGQETCGNAVCEKGHFVCDRCHAHDALSIIEEVCLGSAETDMIALMEKIRNHPAFPLHGPEHHSMIPAIILTAYRNVTGKVTDEQILMGMERGGTYAGGSCAFFGVCGAAAGVGIAFSIILRSDPYKARERQAVQQATAEVLGAIGQYKAPRCCQRDCWVALKEVARLSERYIGVALQAEKDLACMQFDQNCECLRTACPLYEDRNAAKTPIQERPVQSKGKAHDTFSARGQ